MRLRRTPILPFLALFTFASCVLVSAETPEEDPWASASAIDVHAHLGTFEGYDLRLETLLENMKRHRIRHALVSNIDAANLPGTTRNLGELEANEETLKVVQSNPGLHGLAWARPGEEGSSPENLRPFLAKHGFLGVKLHPQFNQFQADARAVEGYFALCEEYKRPVVVHCAEAAPIYRMARRCPTVAVILYHSGFFTDHLEAIRTVEEAVKKGDAQLYLETAQVEPEAVLEMIRRVGVDRVVFGTDATYYGKHHYRKYTPMVKLLKENLPEADFHKVMSGNAKRLFHISD